MSPSFRIVYFAHAVRSDWNNGNAHFLRGLLRSMSQLGHDVTIFEPEDGWSIENLRREESGEASLAEFAVNFPDLQVEPYSSQSFIETQSRHCWRDQLKHTDVVILHEWNPPELAHCLLELRQELGFRLLFHDTHHRASSSPEQIKLFGIDRFDGVIAFGAALGFIYRERFNIRRTWTLHEAADTTVFRPLPRRAKQQDLVWIGNWGDDERSSEICQFLLRPAEALPERSFTIFGVRYPPEALSSLKGAGIRYGGYLPNVAGPAVYAESRLTLHIPRQQYAQAMTGIPTIRVFEALACRIPLISAPWKDTEQLFQKGDFMQVRNSSEARSAIDGLLRDPALAEQQAAQGLATVLTRHTCMHRAQELTAICEEITK